MAGTPCRCLSVVAAAAAAAAYDDDGKAFMSLLHHGRVTFLVNLTSRHVK